MKVEILEAIRKLLGLETEEDNEATLPFGSVVPIISEPSWRANAGVGREPQDHNDIQGKPATLYTNGQDGERCNINHEQLTVLSTKL
jgi:hypothetical protein